MDIPDDLAHQIQLFRETGRVAVLEPEGFAEPSWASMFFGLGVFPQRYGPYVDLLDINAIRQHLGGVHDAIRRTVQAMPTHADFLAHTGTAR